MIAKCIRSTRTDRDTGRWKLDPTETQRRREAFWELYVYDSWQVREVTTCLDLV